MNSSIIKKNKKILLDSSTTIVISNKMDSINSSKKKDSFTETPSKNYRDSKHFKPNTILKEVPSTDIKSNPLLNNLK